MELFHPHDQLIKEKGMNCFNFYTLKNPSKNAFTVFLKWSSEYTYLEGGPKLSFNEQRCALISSGSRGENQLVSLLDLLKK